MFEKETSSIPSLQDTSGSCISVLTFDENSLGDSVAFSKHQPGHFTDVSIEEDDIVPPFLVSDDIKTLNERKTSITSPKSLRHIQPRGSLYCRIMNSLIREETSQHSRNDLQAESKQSTCIIGDYKKENRDLQPYIDLSCESTKSIASNDCECISPQELIRDEWREVEHKSSGKVYYYNRRTRESRWKLPASAVLVSKRKRKIIEVTPKKCKSLERLNYSKSSESETFVSNSPRQHFSPDDKIVDCSDKYEKHAGVQANSFRDCHTNSEQKQYEKIEIRDGSINGQCFEEETSVVNNQESVNKLHEKLRNDRQEVSYSNFETNLFCMFCGRRERSVSDLINHLQKVCPNFTHRQDMAQDVCDVLIKSLGSTRLGSANANLVKKYDTVFPILDRDGCTKENIAVVEDEYDYYNQCTPINEGNAEGQAYLSSSEENSSIYAEDEIATSCPFCNDSFHSGSQFSKHLLRCRKRKSSVKNRTTPLSKNKATKRYTRNLQSCLLVGGGRHLPGYPKVI